ncbi:MAG: beta-ketoacyl-[acyl-carrier-protein] synthase family protein [Candidatus Methylacidiphilales bacterium]
MRRVVITGLGFISSLGNSKETVLDSLKNSRSGIELFEEFAPEAYPVKLAGTVKGFSFPTYKPETWTYPPEYQFERSVLRSLSPHGLHAHCAMLQAIADAGLKPDEVSHPRTALYGSSAGSPWLLHEALNTLEQRGIHRMSPMCIPSSIAGTLHMNLASQFHIKGGALGVISACASSSHGLGLAYDQIFLGKKDRFFVVGAEDLNVHADMPFASLRALSTSKDPDRFPCAFDRERDGFVATGGAAILVIEELEVALRRGARIYAEMKGWAESSDGHSLVIPHPEGEGLQRAMTEAIASAGYRPEEIDYINAHATATPVGDIAELKAIKSVFPSGQRPKVSSTKSLSGHGLCLAGALEAGFTALSLHEGFMPASAKIQELDDECEGVPILTEVSNSAPQVALSNSSGFGGSNVTLVFSTYPAI